MHLSFKLSLSETLMSMEDLLKQIKSDNEDLKLKLDAILNALILPHLGENKRKIKERISKRVRGRVGRKIWNLINGERTLAQIGENIEKKPQIVLKYIKRWEQESPPLVYVSKMKEGAKVYKRIFEVKLSVPKTEKKTENTKHKETQEQNEKTNLPLSLQ